MHIHLFIVPKTKNGYISNVVILGMLKNEKKSGSCGKQQKKLDFKKNGKECHHCRE